MFTSDVLVFLSISHLIQIGTVLRENLIVCLIASEWPSIDENSKWHKSLSISVDTLLILQFLASFCQSRPTNQHLCPLLALSQPFHSKHPNYTTSKVQQNLKSTKFCVDLGGELFFQGGKEPALPSVVLLTFTQVWRRGCRINVTYRRLSKEEGDEEVRLWSQRFLNIGDDWMSTREYLSQEKLWNRIKERAVWLSSQEHVLWFCHCHTYSLLYSTWW